MKEDNSLFIVVIVLLLLVLFSGFGMIGGGFGGMMLGMMGGFGLGMMLFGWLFSILVFVALILFIVWLVQQIQK